MQGAAQLHDTILYKNAPLMSLKWEKQPLHGSFAPHSRPTVMSIVFCCKDGIKKKPLWVSRSFVVKKIFHFI